MTNEFTRRFILAGLASGAGQAALAEGLGASLRPLARSEPIETAEADVATPELIRPRERPENLGVPEAANIDDILKKAKLGGNVSICLRDTSSGRVIEQVDGFEGLPPASVSKVVTTLYARKMLGPGYRFETHLVATGPVENGVIQGDLLLIGGGDPEFDTNAMAAMIIALKDQGVTGATGALRGWGGALPLVERLDPTQPDQVGYNPTISGMTLNFNRVHFTWRRAGNGYDFTMDGRSDTYVPVVKIARMKAVNRSRPVYTYSDGGTFDSWTVASKKLGNGGTRWLPVRKPVRYADEVFVVLARYLGIELTLGDPVSEPPRGQILVTHESEDLDHIMKDMLKYSNNLTAEICGLTATRAYQGEVKDLKESARHMEEWAASELGLEGGHFVDHSGLGQESRMSAAALTRALANVHGKGLRPLLKPIPIRNENYQVQKGYPLEVMAKTGTLFFVSSLSGYVRRPGGQDMAFAIFTANEKLRTKVDSEVEESPAGAPGWNRRAKILQLDLLKRWGTLYGNQS